MRHRLPIVLSVTALFVAVLGFTSVGEAAKNAVLGRDSVTSKELKNNSVGANHLKPNSVGSGKLKNETVLSIDLRDGQVNTPDLRTGSVTSDKLAANSVTTSKLASGPSARVASSANAAVLTGAAFVALPFNLETFDPSGMHNPTATPSRLTIATPGLYLVGASVTWACCPVHPELSLRLTSGPNVTFPVRVSQPGEGMMVSEQSVTTLVSLKAGDFVEVVVRQAAGGVPPGVVLAQTGANKPAFWATWIGN